MFTVIVNKTSLRVVFVAHAQAPLLLDALYPPVGYNYITWLGQIDERVRRAPWEYVVSGNEFVKNLDDQNTMQSLIENQARGMLLLELAKGVNRYRRQVLKEDLLGQDVVYNAKVTEAHAWIAQRDLNMGGNTEAHFPWLRDAAAHDGVTLDQAAEAVIFRHTQAMELLRHSERRRRALTRSILETPFNELQRVADEVREYVRRG